MKRYYNCKTKCLIYCSSNADQFYWDTQWQQQQQKFPAVCRPSWLVSLTKKYLPLGSRVLEGGCGLGLHVRGLHKYGFLPVGIDYASNTISILNKKFPELQFLLGDIRSLPFSPNSFAGYWSIGVIEHFWGGYSGILSEAHRVLQANGYFFLTFPVMSPLRRLKARFGLYDSYTSEYEPDSFYQFALYPTDVIGTVEAQGFSLVNSLRYDAFKGFKDELTFVRPALQLIYSNQSFFCRVLRYAVNILFSGFAGHSQILIFRKI